MTTMDVLADGLVVGRIMKAAAAPEGAPWLWMLAYGQHEDRTPTQGYEPTREAAMAEFATELAAAVASRHGPNPSLTSRASQFIPAKRNVGMPSLG